MIPQTPSRQRSRTAARDAGIRRRLVLLAAERRRGGGRARVADDDLPARRDDDNLAGFKLQGSSTPLGQGTQRARDDCEGKERDRRRHGDSVALDLASLLAYKRGVGARGAAQASAAAWTADCVFTGAAPLVRAAGIARRRQHRHPEQRQSSHPFTDTPRRFSHTTGRGRVKGRRARR